MPALSQSPTLSIAAGAFATIFIGFGINAFVRPANALSFFEFAPPSSDVERKLVDSLMVVYGARDIFMGLASHSTAFLGTRRALGWVLVSASAGAFVDGLVCWSHGKGEWNHWGYASIITMVGMMLLGLLDRV